MTSFDFGSTAGKSQNTSLNQLEGNKIHEVTFNGCEARDFAGKADPSMTYKVLNIKFSNKDGQFVHTIWQPRKEDFEDQPGNEYGPRPANAKAMVYLLKHLIDAVVPEIAKRIDNGEIKMSVSVDNWDELRSFICKVTDQGKGRQTKIKLMKNNKGEAIFPFFASYDRSGEFRMTTNFIGDNIFWLTNELKKIQAAETAKPTPVSNSIDFAVTNAEKPAPAAQNVDFEF